MATRAYRMVQCCWYTTVPTLSYAELGIHEGASAQRLWMQGVIDGKDSIDKEVLFADLLEYCKLDTLAMVEIFNVLRKL